MRDYGRVSGKFWTGKTGKELRKKGIEAQLVALYLQTCPHANMLGLYYLPKSFIQHETGLTLQGTTKGLAWCIEAGFCRYDDESEMVWVIEMAHYQIAPKLSPNDKQTKGVQKVYDDLQENPFLGEFFDKYQPDFHLTHRREIEGAPKGDSKPLGSQEQEQEQKQEQAQDSNAGLAPAAVDPVVAIFEWWQKVMSSPKSVLDDKRKATIKKALANYEPRQLCRAIIGCAKSDFHMARGEYAGKNKHNGIDLIFRDAEHIDKFIKIDEDKPSGSSAAGGETLEEANARIMREALGGQAAATPVDGNVIDMER